MTRSPAKIERRRKCNQVGADKESAYFLIWQSLQVMLEGVVADHHDMPVMISVLRKGILEFKNISLI